MEIVKPLRETEVIEGNPVTLICEVNKPNVKATWFKDKVEIGQSENCVLGVNGNVHTLALFKAELDDEAEYTIKLEDKESTALLLVEGECFNPCET